MLYRFVLAFVIALTSTWTLAASEVPKKQKIEGLGGCWSDDDGEPGKKLRSKIDTRRKELQLAFANVKGSGSAQIAELKNVYFFKDEGGNPVVLMEPGFENLEKAPGGVVASTVLVEGASNEPAIDVYTPKKPIPLTISLSNGKKTKMRIKKFNFDNTSCDYERHYVYFVENKKKKLTHPDLFIGCMASKSCSFTLNKLNKNKDLDIYTLTADKQVNPDYIIAINPNARAAKYGELHILKSTPKGWEFLQSIDNSECEGGC
jgi:hypothetical protein